MRQAIKILLLLVISTLIISCEQSEFDDIGSGQQVPLEVTPEILTQGSVEWIESEAAIVESVDILIMESWPLQVNAIVTGSLPDGCTSIYRSSSQRFSQRFNISLITRRPKDAFCTEALVPFEAVVPLEVSGLAAGSYLVDAYGKQAEFTFEQENHIPRPSS